MTALLAPSSLADLAEAVRSTVRVIAVGARTKRGPIAGDRMEISTRALTGITEYEPSEFTFTALAGTPVSEIAEALSERGQYLPFDPMLLAAGASLGGTVAAGLSGPGSYRFGGLRDFILGVRFVDGSGKVLRVGGKVVKNAAGFDLPKFFVGSLGCFGLLAEFTFKVFPKPAHTLTLKIPVKSPQDAQSIFVQASRSRWEPDALDFLPAGQEVAIRLAGPEMALASIASEILSRWKGEALGVTEAERLWTNLREFQWAYRAGVLVKVALAPAILPAFCEELKAISEAKLHATIGGHVGFVSLPTPGQSTPLDSLLTKLGLAGVALRGDGPLWYGTKARAKIDRAIKEALDGENRFPELDEMPCGDRLTA